MSPIAVKSNPIAMMSVLSVAILLTALSAHPQTITGAPSGSTSPPSTNAQSGQVTSSGSKTTPMGSAADASGHAGTKVAAKTADVKVSRSDANFMRDIAYANLSEIAAAKLAQSKSQNDQVKSFAQKMMDDHTKAQDELNQLAQSKDVTLPTEPDAKHKAEAKVLEKMAPDKFDAMYTKEAGLNDHRKAHKLLEKVSKKAKDPDLKAYAEKTLGPVDDHLKMAQQMPKSK